MLPSRHISRCLFCFGFVLRLINFLEVRWLPRAVRATWCVVYLCHERRNRDPITLPEEQWRTFSNVSSKSFLEFYWSQKSHVPIYKLIIGKGIAIETTGPTSGVEGGAASHKALGLCMEEVITWTNFKFHLGRLWQWTLDKQKKCLLQIENKNTIPGCFQVLKSCFQVNSVFLLLVVTFGNRSAIIH